MQHVVGKHEGKRSLGEPSCRWQDNSKVVLKESMACINLFQDNVQWLRFQYIWAISLLPEWISALQGLQSRENNSHTAKSKILSPHNFSLCRLHGISKLLPILTIDLIRLMKQFTVLTAFRILSIKCGSIYYKVEVLSSADVGHLHLAGR
jgi:hypothetical protein